MVGGLRSRYASARALRPLRRAAALLLAGVWLAASLPASFADESGEASTSQATRQQAARAIPLAKVDPKYRQQVSEVLADPSIFRRMPTNVVDCQPDLFTFLAQNPEVLTEIWRNLGVSKVELTRTAENTFELHDNAGTTGTLHVVEQTCDDGAQNRIVMYAEGSYDGKPFNKPVGARCVLVLTSGSVKETNGRFYVASRLDSFVKLDRASVEFMAQIAHPFVGKTADRNFADTLSFVSNLSYTAEERPERIVSMASELTEVSTSRRERLASLARECAEAGAAWKLTRQGQSAVETAALEAEVK
jgi:hypothetical protein